MVDPNEKKKGIRNFARYSSVSFQMLATIGLFAFAGYKIDQYRASDKLIFMALLGIVGVAVSLYQVVKQLNKNED